MARSLRDGISQSGFCLFSKIVLILAREVVAGMLEAS